LPLFATLFTSGRIAELIILLVIVEAAALLAYRRRTGRGLPPAVLLPHLLAGVCLLLALRAGLAGMHWGWLALALLAALAAHLLDLAGLFRALNQRR